MAIFVIGIIIAIIGVCILPIKAKKENYWITNQTVVRTTGLSTLVFGIILILVSFIKTVPTGHTGIVTSFGKVEDRNLEAGIHLMAPWKKVVKMDNRTQKEVINLGCFSSDIQEVQVTYTINYQINKNNAQTIYKTIGAQYFDTIVEPKALEAVKGVFAKYNAENLVSSRATLSKEIENILVAEMETYNIQITATSIEEIDFTDAFTNAVEEKQVAEQNKLKAQTEQEQKNIEAEAEAKRKVIAAQAEADSKIISANNDAEVAKIQADSAEYQGQKDAAIMSNLGKMLQTYPELIKYYQAIGWNGELPDTMLSDNVFPMIGID